MPQFMFPPPSMTEDLTSNWEFLKDNLKDYATETKLGQKDKKYISSSRYGFLGENVFKSAAISWWPKMKEIIWSYFQET